MFMIRENGELREADEVSRDAFKRLTPEQLKKVRAMAQAHVQALMAKTKEQNSQK
jgi:hypothetical protein